MDPVPLGSHNEVVIDKGCKNIGNIFEKLENTTSWVSPVVNGESHTSNANKNISEKDLEDGSENERGESNISSSKCKNSAVKRPFVDTIIENIQGNSNENVQFITGFTTSPVPEVDISVHNTVKKERVQRTFLQSLLATRLKELNSSKKIGDEGSLKPNICETTFEMNDVVNAQFMPLNETVGNVETEIDISNISDNGENIVIDELCSASQDSIKIEFSQEEISCNEIENDQGKPKPNLVEMDEVVVPHFSNISADEVVKSRGRKKGQVPIRIKLKTQSQTVTKDGNATKGCNATKDGNATKSGNATKVVNVTKDGNVTKDKKGNNKPKGGSKQEKDYICTECGEGFPNNPFLRQHIRAQHKEGVFECTICNKIYHRRDSLKYHLSKKHGDTKTYKCSKCTKTFFSESERDLHIQNHPERVATCGECNKSFSRMSTLTKHRKIHHDITPLPYPCQLCDKTFSTRYNLMSHLHYKHKLSAQDLALRYELKYNCEHCDELFNKRNDWLLHQRVHKPPIGHDASGKPSCTVCGKTFTRIDDCKRHMRIHSGLRPHYCLVCSHTFETNEKLQTHINVKHMEK